MVYIPASGHVAQTRLTAFLTAELSRDQLDAIHTQFERGAYSQFPTPTAELFIKDNPDYHHLTHAEIRRAEPGEDPFLVIDVNTPDDGGIWYIAQFATEDEVEDGEAESTDVLWKIRIRIEDVPIMHAGYDIANSSIPEDLGQVGVDVPVPEEFEQESLLESGLDHDQEQYRQPCWIIAEPGEFEETTDEAILNTMRPRPRKMARLKEHVAKANGLTTTWAVPTETTSRELPDGSTKTFSVGSVTLQLKYDPEFPWPAYQRLEGTL